MVHAVCSRCAAPMLHLKLGTGIAFACNGCGAVFLGHDHARRVRAGLDREARVLAERGAEMHPPIDPSRDTGPLACPSCRRTMTPEWTCQNQVRLDHCLEHGTFFDAHELTAVVPRQARPNPHPEKRGPIFEGWGDAGLEVVATLLLGGD